MSKSYLSSSTNSSYIEFVLYSNSSKIIVLANNSFTIFTEIKNISANLLIIIKRCSQNFQFCFTA